MKKRIKIYNAELLTEDTLDSNYIPASGSFFTSTKKIIIGINFLMHVLYPDNTAKRFEGSYTPTKINIKFICDSSREDFDMVANCLLEKEIGLGDPIDHLIKEIYLNKFYRAKENKKNKRTLMDSFETLTCSGSLSDDFSGIGVYWNFKDNKPGKLGPVK